MAQLDPIVVNEAKKLEVPQFNKKEIEQISVNATKKAISDGEISAGAKLYKHTIVTQEAKEEMAFTIELITTTNTPKTIATFFDDVVSIDFGFGNYYEGTEDEMSAIYYPIKDPSFIASEDSVRLLCIFSNRSWGYNLAGYMNTITSDTVTEL